MAGKRASEGAGEGEPLRYGRRHAQTEELYHAHALEKQLEALAAEEEKPAPAPSVQAAAPPALGVPIGGLGEAAAPPPLEGEAPRAAPQEGVLRGTVKETRRRVEAVALAAVKLAKEAGHLVHLPLEVLRRVRHQLLRRPGWI
ncbi:MAG: hypothetical protein ACYC8T_01610 [Myxococcaceae bacterium]